MLVHVLDEIGGRRGLRRGAVRILQLHPVALIEEVHRIVGAVLQSVGFRDLVGAQGVGHVTLRPSAELCEHGLAGTECLLAVDIHRGDHTGVVRFLELLHGLAPHVLGQVVHIVLKRAARAVQQRHEGPRKVAVGQGVGAFRQLAFEVLDLVDGDESIVEDVLQVALLDQILVVVDGHLVQVQRDAIGLAIDGDALPSGGQEAALLEVRSDLLPIVHGVEQTLGLQDGSLELIADNDVGDVLAGLHHRIDLRGQIAAVHRLEDDLVIALCVVFLDDALHRRTVISHQVVPEVNGLAFARRGTAASGGKHKSK